MSPDAGDRVTKTLYSGWIGEGERVVEFEQELQKVLKTPRPPVAMNSCTSALDLSFHIIGIKQGDPVLSTPMSCTATSTNLVTRGAKIVWSDIDPITGLINPDDAILKAKTTNAKAIVAVDWSGRVCDYEKLMTAGIPVVRDAAHCVFAGTDKHVASFTAWSHQAIKFLTTGDGGALLPPAEEDERARLLRWYGFSRKSKSDTAFRCGKQKVMECGYKYNLIDINASIGLANIKHVGDIVRKHKSNARYLYERIPDCHPRLQKPPFDAGCDYWFMNILVEDRDGFIRHMQDHGVMTSPVHARNDIHPAFISATHEATGDLAGVDYFSSREIGLPCGWWVTQEDLDIIVKAVEKWIVR